jgi:cell shape-determining protein MreC
MMPSSVPGSHFRLAALLCALALGLGFLPEGQVAKVRTHLLDALKPGLDGLRAALVRWQRVKDTYAFSWPRFSSDENAEEASRLQAELLYWRHRCRQWEIETARLHQKMEELKRVGPSPYPTRAGKPLLDVELLEAAVLDRENESLWRSNRLIDRGQGDGISEADLVLEGTGPVIDQGQDEDLQPGHPVYAGRSVVGRLAHVGKYVSTIQKVTDENYRGFAQLIRRTETGFVFGAEGVLEGQGQDLCLLKYVPGTLPVEVGDEVYTGDHDGAQPYPMYYGRVVRAELNPGDQEWTIWVEPAITTLKTPTVTVLRTQLDASRTVTN